MTRREFIGFFLIGVIVAFFRRTFGAAERKIRREAMFWRRKDES